MSATSAPASSARGGENMPADRHRPRPWRTEGLPKGQPSKTRPRWNTAVWIVAYALLFALLTMQDRSAKPRAVSYTEFKVQVAAANVSEVFARGSTIEGEPRKGAPTPGEEGQTYQQFTTERPTFAADDLLGELIQGKATVRATPLVRERGALTNLVISLMPILLLLAFYTWMFKRRRASCGRPPAPPRSRGRGRRRHRAERAEPAGAVH